MVYRDYVERYPVGDGAERVKQRFAGLMTARKQPRDKLRTTRTEARAEQKENWDLFGGISQYYRRDVNTTDIDNDDVKSICS
jgi:hypothetical protein